MVGVARGVAPVVLLVCTGNTCRSPMAEVLLRRALADRGVPARVCSAGLLAGGQPAAAEAVQAMAARGLDLAGHQSHRITTEDVRGADLVLGMAREHVRDVVVLEPAAWPRTFTVKELVRRGAHLGPRAPDEPWGSWLARLHADRSRSDLLGQSAQDDVADPVGAPLAEYLETAQLLEGAFAVLAALLAGDPAP